MSLLRDMHAVKQSCEGLNGRKKNRKPMIDKTKNVEKTEDKTTDDQFDKIKATLEEFMEMRITKRFENNDFSLICEQVSCVDVCTCEGVYSCSVLKFRMRKWIIRCFDWIQSLNVSAMDMICMATSNTAKSPISFAADVPAKALCIRLFEFCEPGEHLLSPAYCTLCSADRGMHSRKVQHSSKDALDCQIPDFTDQVASDEERERLSNGPSIDVLRKSKIPCPWPIRNSSCLFQIILTDGKSFSKSLKRNCQWSPLFLVSNMIIVNAFRLNASRKEEQTLRR